MRIAIITGASSGMGRELVKQLSKKESFDEIWTIARREERLLELKDEIENVRPVPLDLTKEESINTLVDMLNQEKPNVAVLANCSGFGKFGTYEDISLQDSMDMIDLNCKALVAVTQVVIPFMNKGAHIMQLDSLSSFQPVPYLNVYAATKAFVLSYSRALNVELKPKGIKVIAVCPGWVSTEFFDHATVTNEKAVTYYNVVYSAKDVIRTAIKDMYKGKKDVSVHGLQIKGQRLLVKLLPHRLVMYIWMKQQHHN